jgi:hypothetical protein
MDYFDGVRDAEILAARAQTEAEEWDRLAELEALDNSDKQKIRKGTKARVKHKSERGKGNFSDFRNKTFITPGLKNKVARNDNNEFKKLPTWGKKHRLAGGGASAGEAEGEDGSEEHSGEDEDTDDVGDEVGNEVLCTTKEGGEAEEYQEDEDDEDEDDE